MAEPKIKQTNRKDMLRKKSKSLSKSKEDKILLAISSSRKASIERLSIKK